MMRIFIFIALLSLSLNSFARGYYAGKIDFYDSTTGLYFKSISSNNSGFIKKGTANISNINIFDPQTKLSKLLFSETTDVNIQSIYFEKKYKENKIEFNQASRNIKNNHNISKRELRDKLLIVTYNSEQEQHSLYVANKKGENLKKIVNITKKQDWHIDVKNSVIRIITKQNNQLKFEERAW